MKLLVLSFFGASAFAQDFGDGIYALSDTETPRSVAREDGTTHWIGARVELDIEQASVFAVDNFNEVFAVRLRYRNESAARASDLLLDPPFDIPSFALIAGDEARVTDTWGGRRGNPMIGFHVTGQDAAERAAALLNTVVISRNHPGHKLLVRFLPASQAKRSTEAIGVELAVTNVGDESVQFDCCAAYQFRFGAARQGEPVPDLGRWQATNAVIGRVTIEPGNTHLIPVALNEWFAFDRSGEYLLWGFYRVVFVVPDDVAGMRPVWTDYFSGEFNVTVLP